MSRKYKKPPIVEAICEFQFQQGSPWDLALPGLIYATLKNTFPKRKQAKDLTLDVLVSSDKMAPRMLEAERLQFFREDEKALVQVAPNRLAVNRLSPYESWEEFSSIIQQGFAAYREVASPEALHQIHVRYINRIELPGPRVELHQYFEFRPFIGSRLPQDHGAFIVGIQVPHEESRDILKIELTSGKSKKPDILAIMLDLDYFLVIPKAVDITNVFDWIKDAHDRVEDSFEACITDNLRLLFEEVTD